MEMEMEMEMEIEMYGLETYAVSPSSPLNHEAIAESYAAEVANARAAQRRRKPRLVQPSVADISAISSAYWSGDEAIVT